MQELLELLIIFSLTTLTSMSMLMYTIRKILNIVGNDGYKINYDNLDKELNSDINKKIKTTFLSLFIPIINIAYTASFTLDMINNKDDIIEYLKNNRIIKKMSKDEESYYNELPKTSRLIDISTLSQEENIKKVSYKDEYDRENTIYYYKNYQKGYIIVNTIGPISNNSLEDIELTLLLCIIEERLMNNLEKYNENNQDTDSFLEDDMQEFENSIKANFNSFIEEEKKKNVKKRVRKKK